LFFIDVCQKLGEGGELKTFCGIAIKARGGVQSFVPAGDWQLITYSIAVDRSVFFVSTQGMKNKSSYFKILM